MGVVGINMYIIKSSSFVFSFLSSRFRFSPCEFRGGGRVFLVRAEGGKSRGLVCVGLIESPWKREGGGST